MAFSNKSSMQPTSRVLGSVLAIVLSSPLALAQDSEPGVRVREGEQGIPPGWVLHQAPHPSPSAAYAWLEVVLEASARDVERLGARPTILSREMAIAVTSMYDAWAAYDDKAVGTRLGGDLRRPPPERTQRNKEVAIAYAAYRALLYVYPHDSAWITEQMRAAGFDPEDTTTDPTKPQGIGNLAAAAVIEYRSRDGANQHGDEVGSNGEPYSDWTFYAPRNPCDRIVDPDCWQPLPFSDGKGGTFFPGFLTPHWYRVKALALERADQFRPGPPPLVGTPELKREVDECIAMNANLSLEEKAIVEFMRDGPRSTGQSGHWLRFAQDVARRDGYDLDREIKLFFCIANTALDTFIAAWDAKRCYDSSRPWTLVRHCYAGKEIVGFLGPCQGFGKIPAERWHPYSPATFVTPPFPGYVSGHSTVSGGCAKLLELFTGNDRYGAIARCEAGILTEPECGTSFMQARDGVEPQGIPSSRAIELELPTFSATAEMAGISRVLGGYHIQADNLEGLALGRQVAAYAWPKFQAYFAGTAQPRD
jgi:hypothetical protein